MLMVGVFGNKYAPTAGPAASSIEWRSHFGAWCIVSSPLILSFDLANVTTLDMVWPFITNLEAIGVNQAWAGHPGRQMNASGSMRVWAKALPEGAQAMFVVNMDAHRASVAFTVHMASLSSTLPADARARDIWAHTEAGRAHEGSFSIPSLLPHDSAFFLFRP